MNPSFNCVKDVIQGKVIMLVEILTNDVEKSGLPCISF